MTHALKKRALERRLRELGASRAEAKSAVARGWLFCWLAALSPRVCLAIARRRDCPDGGRHG